MTVHAALSIDCHEELLEGLPQLRGKAALDSELTLEGLTAAVEHLAPGIDGLSTDCLKKFWGFSWT